jgi:acyl-CoA thioesterase-2
MRHDASVTIPPPVLTLSQVLDTFNLQQVNAEFFVGHQIDEIDHHVVGGHIAAQTLMAATMAEQLSGYADERAGWWVREQPIEMRYIDPPARLALDLAEPPSARIRIWWRPNGTPPSDPILASCLVVYVSGRTLPEPAMIAHRTTPLGPGNSALMDHAVWFHRAPDLSDWLLYEQHSPNGIGGRGLAQGTMFNRSGQLVCTTMLEGYFGRRPRGLA